MLIFGLISGAVAAGMMLATIPFITSHSFKQSEILGYTSIALSALLVFFGVRSYRENVGGGRLTFGRGLAVGILITLISCAMYVATWEILDFGVMPGLGDTVAACMVEQAKASGASPEKVDEATRQAETYRTMSQNPALNVAMTLAEPLPVGILVTAISAAILRKKK